MDTGYSSVCWVLLRDWDRDCRRREGCPPRSRPVNRGRARVGTVTWVTCGYLPRRPSEFRLPEGGRRVWFGSITLRLWYAEHCWASCLPEKRGVLQLCCCFHFSGSLAIVAIIAITTIIIIVDFQATSQVAYRHQ